MVKPEAFKYRGNTGNTGYGFDQVQDSSEDDDSSKSDDKDPEPNGYRFKAAANRGSLADRKPGAPTNAPHGRSRFMMAGRVK